MTLASYFISLGPKFLKKKIWPVNQLAHPEEEAPGTELSTDSPQEGTCPGALGALGPVAQLGQGL